MRPPFPPYRLASVVAGFDAVLRRVVRHGIDDPEAMLERARAGEPMIFACRHGELWPLLWVVADCDVSVLTSRSGDGELLARVLARRGFCLLRGSSSSAGFAAGRDALRVLRAGGRVGLAVDGPRGPRGLVQDGALRLAQRTGVPIVALRRRGGRPWVAPGSWDRFEIPRPGDRVTVAVSGPIHVGNGAAALDLAGGRLAVLLDGERPRAEDGATRVPAWSRPAPEAP